MKRQLTVWTETTAGQVVGQVRADIDGTDTPIISLAVAARHLGYSPRHMRHLCEEGKLIAIKLAGAWWIVQRDVLEWPLAGVRQ